MTAARAKLRGAAPDAAAALTLTKADLLASEPLPEEDAINGHLQVLASVRYLG